MSEQVIVASSGGSSKIFSIFTFMFRYFSIWFTVFLVLVIILGALNESIKTNSLYPIIREVGKRTVGAELTLEKTVFKIVEKKYEIPDLNQKILANRIKIQFYKLYMFFELFSALWMIYIIARGIYWIFMFLFSQYSSQAILITILIIMGIEIIFSQTDYIISMSGQTMPPIAENLKEIGYRFLPFRGIGWLIFYSPTIVDNILNLQPYQLISNPITDKTIGGISNETVSKVGEKIINVTTGIITTGG